MSSTRKALKYMHMYVGALIGFTDIREYDDQKATKELRAPLATSMLLLMARGPFTHLKYSYYMCGFGRYFVT